MPVFRRDTPTQKVWRGWGLMRFNNYNFKNSQNDTHSPNDGNNTWTKNGLNSLFGLKGAPVGAELDLQITDLSKHKAGVKALEEIERRLGSLGHEGSSIDWGIAPAAILSASAHQPLLPAPPPSSFTQAAMSAEELEARMLMEAAVRAGRQPTPSAFPAGVIRPTPINPSALQHPPPFNLMMQDMQRAQNMHSPMILGRNQIPPPLVASLLPLSAPPPTHQHYPPQTSMQFR